MKLRVVIADDHAILLEGLASLLADTPDIELVGQATDGDQVLDIVIQQTPDIVVCDVSMPTFGAEELARRLHSAKVATRVIALTIHNEPEVVHKVLSAGVSGYVVKNCAFEDLLASIRAVAAGGTFISPSLGVSWLNPVEESTPAESLSAREREVLVGLGRGLPYKKIAADLGISVRTVETYRARILSKLNLQTTADLIRFAAEQKWL